jgi:hypothetical protein
MKKEDKDTRYYLDLDLKARKILTWDYDQRYGLAQVLPDPFHHRVFLTKGQYNKLVQHAEMIKSTYGNRA